MSTKRKDEAKDTSPTPWSEPEPVRKKTKVSNHAKSRLEGKNPQEEPIPVEDLHHQSSSTPSSVAPNSDSSAHQSSSTIFPPLFTDVSSMNAGSSQEIQSHDSYNRMHVGDDNRDNKGIVGHGSFNLLVQGGNVQFYGNAPGERSESSTQFILNAAAFIYLKATQEVLGGLFHNVINRTEGMPAEANLAGHSTVERDDSGAPHYHPRDLRSELSRLVSSIKLIIEGDDHSILRVLRDHLRELWSELGQEREQSCNAGNSPVNFETLTWRLRLFLFVNHMRRYIGAEMVVEGVKKRMMEAQRNAEAISPRQSIKDLTHARAAYDDYTPSNRGRVSCFEGTRQALLEEIAEWVAKSDTEIFVLFGLAGIGKSTIAQTIAEKADNVRLLGASFFFSRVDAERRTAEKFFTTIAFQLCLHDNQFAEAIDKVLMTDQGRGAVTKHPLEQLESLILGPLAKLAPRRVVIVVDALDECDDSDGPIILQGLNKLVQSLPLFKVVLTTRPQPHLQFLLDGQASQKIFHLHNIDEKVIDSDIELYFRHHLSWEKVKLRLPTLRRPWCAGEQDIHALVRAAGRLFIIASTAVLFILDKAGNPTTRMKILLGALEKDHTPFKALNAFYTTILRGAVPENCEDDTRDRYQIVIGTIILTQQPLSVSALAMLANIDVDDITLVLGNLQPVILLTNNDIPLVYHKSFPDYIQDPARCTDDDLRIDPNFHHTRMTIRCLQLLNQCLKQNIMDLGDPARFMDNDTALKEQNVTELYTGESSVGNVEDTKLALELRIFINEKLLNWIEALSWIEKLDSAHSHLVIVQKHLTPISSDLHQLLADMLHFVGDFYDLIRRSALYMYHSALPFTPTETSLYKRYSEQMMFCRVEGGQKKWDALVAEPQFFDSVSGVTFSRDSTSLACHTWGRPNEGLEIRDAIAGTPLGTITGRVLTIANDFSKAAAFNDGLITLYNVKGIIPVAKIKPSTAVVRLLLSPGGSRLVAGLDDATVGLWDAEKCKQIRNLGEWKHDLPIAISLDGSRTAFTSCDGAVKLLDGINGKSIADLSTFPDLERSRLMFLGNGSRLACWMLASGMQVLKVWNSRNGVLVGSTEDVVHMGMSTDESLLVTGNGGKLKLWSSNNMALLKTLDIDSSIQSFAIHNNLLGYASYRGEVTLYDINCQGLIARLPYDNPRYIAFSPDGTRLAVGGSKAVGLWDVPSITIANTTLQEQLSEPTQLAFSPDCSRLASGHQDGTVKLWDTSNMTQVVTQKYHSGGVTALAFSINSGEFASGSNNGIVQFQSDKDGMPSGVLECGSGLIAMALSSSILATATDKSITLWDLDAHAIIAMLDQCVTTHLTLSHHHHILAIATHRWETVTCAQTSLTLWNIKQVMQVTTFDLSDTVIESMAFVPDHSQLALRTYISHGNNSFQLFDIHSNKVSDIQDISQLGAFPCFHGIPVWLNHGKFVGQFPSKWHPIVVLDNAGRRDLGSPVAEGSSMIAVVHKDGHIILIKAV